MNIGLWAEIRRLAEIEKLSGRAIAARCDARDTSLPQRFQTGSAPLALGLAPPQSLGPPQGQDQRAGSQMS